MRQNEHGRVLVTHWFHYLMVARDARDRTVETMAADTSAFPGEALSSILMAAMATEAFVNELTEVADMAAIGYESIESDALATLGDLASALTEVETEKGSLALKYHVAALVMSGRTFDRGAQPFQDFRRLVLLRNRLVHLRPGDELDEYGRMMPMEKLIRGFQNEGLTRTADSDGSGAPEMSWLNELETDRMARWAYASARAIIAAVGQMIPTDPPRTTRTDMMFREPTARIPA
jgi:hypothetical protein